MIFETIFWLLVALIFYVYFGYPLLLSILSKLFPVPTVQKAEINPTISLVIAAYNEEKIITQKIENCLVLNYPSEKIEVIVASDGSMDRTNEIVSQYAGQGVSLVALNPNQGKSKAQNRAVSEAKGDIILFTDADVMLQPDAVKKIINNFDDYKVGCVIGKINYSNVGDTSVSEGEGIYWKYEHFLRYKESEVGNFAMGSGFMAIRRELFQPLNPHVGEDFVLPMRTVMSGYRVVYEPEAISETVLHQTCVRNMLRSKVRVISKDLRGLLLCRTILDLFRYPLYAWGLISHKLLRWLVPYFLLATFALNLLLIGKPFFHLVFYVHIAFYMLALVGYIWQLRGKPPHIISLPFSFSLVNFAALVGVAMFVMGKKTGRWEPVR